MADTAQIVRETRKTLKLDPTQFGALLGVHQLTVWRWEKGEGGPSDYQLAFMNQFRRAAQAKAVREGIGQLMVTLGVIGVIALLLNAASQESRR